MMLESIGSIVERRAQTPENHESPQAALFVDSPFIRCFPQSQPKAMMMWEIRGDGEVENAEGGALSVWQPDWGTVAE
ncbi:hypothetical protein SAMN05444166_2049 [Singulisphaera sp. GP187]|nr:hypothetical protein SAMN05444166_2049 [Singulisphaera sp. GP187]